MSVRTKIIIQQILNIDDTTTTASKYPKYTVVLGNSISSITAGELTAAIEAAADSAASAKDSEIAAKISETNAKDSEIQAGIHADASEASATQSATSATESEKQAGLAQSSADNSAASAQESKGFRDSAELAAQNAEQSRLLAEQAKIAAQTAQTGAEAAEQRTASSEVKAANSASKAEIHATAAKQSELNAKTSETNAAASEGEAANQAVNATSEADRAKAEADRASQVVDSKLDKVDISGFIKVYKTKAEADADVSNRVLGEKVLVWNQTDSKYGWYKVAGTVEAPALELVEIEQKLVSINNVHADDAGNVQITLPGGNPSLWLGEVTWFPYDKDSGVGYPGVLPADGREVLRVDYPDTWEAIEAGLIPSVSEAEWQAGATLYFSTGDGSTTFRLPDMMQGQAFRAPIKGEEDAGAIKEQIPYITTVNGVGPADDTGAIKLPYVAMVNGAIVPDENGNLSLGNVVTKNVWDGTSGEVLLRGAFGLGGAGIALNEPDLVSFFKACRAFGSGYYRNDTGISGLPAYSAGFYSRTADTHSFICPQYSSGIVFVGVINDNQLDGENPIVHTNTLYGTANKPDLNNDTQGTLALNKGGTGASDIQGAKVNLEIDRVKQQAGETYLSSQNPNVVFIVQDTKNWGTYDAVEGKWIPLAIAQGGTGSVEAPQARTNLGAAASGINFDITQLRELRDWPLVIRNGGFISHKKHTVPATGAYLGSEVFSAQIHLDNSIDPDTPRLEALFYSEGNYGQSNTERATIAAYRRTGDGTLNATKYANLYMDSGAWHADFIEAVGYHKAWDGDSYGFFAPFQCTNVGANDGGFVPIISGYTMSTGGYPMRATTGMISRGTSAWPAYVIRLRGDLDWGCTYQFHMTGDIDGWGAVYGGSTFNFTYTKNAVSDINLKDNIQDVSGEESLENIEKMEFKKFTYKFDKNKSIRRGVIAQQIAIIDPQYVKEIGNPENDDTTLTLDTNPLLMDALAAIKVLSERNKELEAKLIEMSNNISSINEKLDLMTRLSNLETELDKIKGTN
ncbi:tail fiber protein [Salmonella phage Sw2]|uniref:L-shaped tail fiber protein n=1 Tax=Salmonella phage Sw2 TaxID=2316014 RepID=A0A385IP56_9CAUD|nr:tail fiber protein [Salmonella phage Sw2]AXY85082.1 L-shaped tail fiber protein [Salmonella phage Sw2]